MNLAQPSRIDRDQAGAVIRIEPLAFFPAPRERRVNARTWPTGKTERMIELLNRGFSFGAIARAMGETRSAIAGQIQRLRQNNDQRLPASPLPLTQAMDALAEAVAEGSGDIAEAAASIRMPYERATLLWGRICRDLGRQAV